METFATSNCFRIQTHRGGFIPSVLALAALLFILPAIRSVPAASFGITGIQTTGRYLNTATLLPNGQVLIAGGRNASGALTNAEIFNPAAALWTTANAMNSARWYHTATLLPNGKVLVAGGRNSTGGNGWSPRRQATDIASFADQLMQSS